MSVSPAATITIDEADPALDGSSVTGVFEVTGNIRYAYEVRTQQFFQAEGTISAISSSVIDFIEGKTDEDIDTGSLRQQLTLDIGGGVFAVELQFQGWEGSNLQWGDGSDDEQLDASGDPAQDQMGVLSRYLTTTTMDSRNTVTLDVGVYGDRYPSLEVIPETPRAEFNSEDETSVFNGSITWIETTSLEKALDSATQEPR
jgi:hypothetical protein